jgi:hypothetical protein
MKINAEGNCSRKYRRLQTPLNINVAGQVCPVRSWSPGGVFFENESLEFATGVPQSAELLLPCTDGVFSLPVQIWPVRNRDRGWGCKFGDIPRRESAILHHYADAIFHGFAVTLSELDAVGQQRAAESSTLLEEPLGRPWLLRGLGIWLRRLAFLAALVAVIALVGSLAVPFFFTRVKSRMNEGNYYLKIAQSRLSTAQLSMDVLDAKLETTEELLKECSGENPRIRISDEQRKILNLGVSQLTAERKMLDVHLGILQADVEAVKKGDYFFEQSVLGGYGTEHHTDPVPYLTEVLADIAQDAKVSPRETEDRQKYEMVAEDRVKQAQYQLASVELRKKALNEILVRCEAQSAGALARNSIDLTQRDIDLLNEDEHRLHDLLTLLEANLTAVRKGNFVFETNLLERYSPDLMRPVASEASSLVR